MPRSVKVKKELTELMYDIKLKIENNEVKKAYEMMKKKVQQIDNKILKGYCRIEWKDKK